MFAGFIVIMLSYFLYRFIAGFVSGTTESFVETHPTPQLTAPVKKIASQAASEEEEKEVVVEEVQVVEVQAEPVPIVDSKPKEKRMARSDGTFPFTLDLKAFIRVALNDPQCREEIIEAFKEGPAQATANLGAANFAAQGEVDQWFTLFMGTDRRIGAGNTGFVFRNKQGTRISMRLKAQQPKNQQAQSLGEVLPEHQGDAALLQKAIQGDPEAAKAILKMASAGPAAPQVESAHISFNDIL